MRSAPMPSIGIFFRAQFTGCAANSGDLTPRSVPNTASATAGFHADATIAELEPLGSWHGRCVRHRIVPSVGGHSALHGRSPVGEFMALLDEISEAHRAIDVGDDARAITMIGSLMTSHAGDGRVWWLSGRFFGLHRAYAEAAEQYLRAIELDRRLSGVQFRVGNRAIELRDVEGSPWAANVLAEFARGMYRLQELAFVPGDLVIDVGAHIGLVSIVLAALHPDVRILAFEPSASNHAMLMGNLARNGITSVTAIQQAVTGFGGPMDLIWAPTDTAAASVMLSEQARQALESRGWTAQRVDCVTLDQVFDEYHVDRCAWLKLDCEGAEWDIVRHSGVLERVDRLSLELHIPESRFDEGADHCLNDFMVPLRGLSRQPTTEVCSMVWLRDT